MMTIIPADYNAATPDGNLRLNFVDSRRALVDINAKVGDRIWVSDNEVLVGAQLVDEPDYGMVARPNWNTLVHLDDFGPDGFSACWAELHSVMQRSEPGPRDEDRIYQLQTALWLLAPAQYKESVPAGHFPVIHACGLYRIGEPVLALISLEEAGRERPTDANVLYLYLTILHRVARERAEVEVRSLIQRPDLGAKAWAACINIGAIAAEDVSDDRYAAAGPEILDWVDRFDQAPGRSEVAANVLAFVQFTRGMTLLRMGRYDEAHQALDHAYAANPDDPIIAEARHLHTYDQTSKALERRFRDKQLPIAA